MHTAYHKLFYIPVKASDIPKPWSMNFENQRRVVLLRDVQKLPWWKIRLRVRGLMGNYPSEKQCRLVYAKFNKRLGRRPYKYGNCGPKVSKLTKPVVRLLLKTLRAQRCKMICTSTTLQAEVSKTMHVKLECSTIRKCLSKHGYHWLPRRQKPKLSREDMNLRWAWVKRVLRTPRAELAKKMKTMMCMDGVVLPVPPSDPTERANFCKIGETHMWRKKGEAAKKELAGKCEYDKQIPRSRQVPMWGGIGPSGFGVVMFHKFRKVDNIEWSAAVAKGGLVSALRDACAPRRQGPWTALCDNESFLEAPRSRAAHKRVRVELWHIPARSPDLNPVEKFWAWVRKQLRAMDLRDLVAGRPPVGKTALKARVKALLRTRQAKLVASRAHGASFFMRVRRCASMLCPSQSVLSRFGVVSTACQGQSPQQLIQHVRLQSCPSAALVLSIAFASLARWWIRTRALSPSRTDTRRQGPHRLW